MDSLALYASTVLCGVIIGGIAVYAYHRAKNKPISKEKVLEHCFGKAFYARTFALAEAKDWIKDRKGKLENGKALICKVNNKTLKMLDTEVKLNFNSGEERYLAIVIVSENSVKDTLLVKYEQLETRLEELLDRGNGVLVIEN